MRTFLNKNPYWVESFIVDIYNSQHEQHLKPLSMSWLTIVETPEFLRVSEKFCERDVIDEMIEAISQNPEIGDIVPNTGGCRKLRWQRTKNSGKSGGMRTIYYFYDSSMPIYLLLTYPKSVADNIDNETENALKRIVKQMVKNHKSDQLRGKI
ncbi:hypothetical protein GCM10010995_00140 [Cysteiniphilum litorale]|uniref:Addiction module toxin RelE n=1 Tax=Cysteiniphilum litorale TaxID=2056700 RepID=A0A8J2Z1W0_9GAMM|nr:hypothetical protein GCM10010995_00140 [Cysteiniphilum litorale]